MLRDPIAPPRIGCYLEVILVELLNLALDDRSIAQVEFKLSSLPPEVLNEIGLLFRLQSLLSILLWLLSHLYHLSREE